MFGCFQVGNANTLVTWPYVGYAGAKVDTKITKASFDFGNFKSGWFGVTIVTTAGFAWSNPYWLADYR